MRDELVKETGITATVDPTYKKAIDDFDKTKKILDKTMKGKENRDKPILGKKEDKITLDESLFEDVEEVLNESKLNEENKGVIPYEYRRAILKFFKDQKRTWQGYPDVMNEYDDGDRSYFVELSNSNPTFISDTRERLEDFLNKLDSEVGYDETSNDNGFYGKTYEFFFYDDDIDEGCKKKSKKKISEALVEIDDDDLVEMLMDRLDTYWNPRDEHAKLFEKMYQSYVEGGVFDGRTINIAEIVDNDWVNYCDVISKNDDYFEDCKRAYADGDYEVHDENNKYIGYIEAVDDEENPTMFLIRIG